MPVCLPKRTSERWRGRPGSARAAGRVRATKGGSIGRSCSRLALLTDLVEPVPGRRRHAGRCHDQLGDGWGLDGSHPSLTTAVSFGHPPLGASGQRVEARVIRGPVERRVVLEINGTKLRIAEHFALVGYPDGCLLR